MGETKTGMVFEGLKSTVALDCPAKPWDQILSQKTLVAVPQFSCLPVTRMKCPERNLCLALQASWRKSKLPGSVTDTKLFHKLSGHNLMLT